MDISAKHCQKTFTISDDPPGDCDHVQCTSLGETIKFPSSLFNYLTVASPVWIIMTHQPYSMYKSYQKSCISHMMHFSVSFKILGVIFYRENAQFSLQVLMVPQLIHSVILYTSLSYIQLTVRSNCTNSIREKERK